MIVLLMLAGTASAQPVSYQLKGDVPQGQKPQIRITAVTSVSDLRIELDRDDGKHFALKHASLAKGAAVTLDVGDGAPGKNSYKGTISAQAASTKQRWSDELAFEALVRAPVKIGYDIDHLDLDKRVLQFTMSRPAGAADLVVIGEDGKELGKGAATYAKEAAGSWLSISWTQPADTRVMMIKLRATTADGLISSVELIPWSVSVDHEDVTFATDRATIESSEEAKLDASLAKITELVKRSQRFLKLRLYIAGHTDTVGGAAKNQKLSSERARAIAAYFKRHGLTIPISFAGFGESVLKVKTADNTDERANRRVDYVLGPEGGTPPFKGPKPSTGWLGVR
ncbi:hypothetical protein BH11MYX3_BH11MYX3_34090 [soil metagenome]